MGDPALETLIKQPVRVKSQGSMCIMEKKDGIHEWILGSLGMTSPGKQQELEPRTES